jgi:hypothetical protein
MIAKKETDMIVKCGLVLMESFRARLLTTVSQFALMGSPNRRPLKVFDIRRLSAEMAAANWHTKTELRGA